MQISELAKMTEMSKDTLRYYNPRLSTILDEAGLS